MIAESILFSFLSLAKFWIWKGKRAGESSSCKSNPSKKDEKKFYGLWFCISIRFGSIWIKYDFWIPNEHRSGVRSGLKKRKHTWNSLDKNTYEFILFHHHLRSSPFQLQFSISGLEGKFLLLCKIISIYKMLPIFHFLFLFINYHCSNLVSQSLK